MGVAAILVMIPGSFIEKFVPLLMETSYVLTARADLENLLENGGRWTNGDERLDGQKNECTISSSC